ncbi:MAG: T9SS type A sorting domain-containing protein [Ignavibacteriae bacterium]|nr:T9SS type A sorting domain-containing protein [Ignavibacteriota bacterium]
MLKVKPKKVRKILFIELLIFFFISGLNLKAQHYYSGDFNPDSLKDVTVTGTVIIDSNYEHSFYYLDENNDGSKDYILNFGPNWYLPDEGNAVRPTNGESITITGGMHVMFDSLNVIVVYQINGEFWRDPFEPMWNNMGNHSHNGTHHQGDCNGYAFGFDHDSLNSINLFGTTIIDSTFIFDSYYLDTNNDSIPDYFLNFGPPWYEPNSNIQKPKNGDEISIVGGMLENNSIPMIIVYLLNGLDWRDSNSVGPLLGGGWAQRNMTDSFFVHSTFDDEDYMNIQPGWYNGGRMHGGGMMTDSLFFQIMEVFPHDIPFSENENIFAGYEIGVFQPNGSNNMWNSGGCGGMMNFNSNINFQLHFNNKQLNGSNWSLENIKAKYWDAQTLNWEEISNAIVDLNNSSVSFSFNTLSNFIILTSNSVTSISNSVNNQVGNKYELYQNYPNPFNPTTTIKYSIPLNEKHGTTKVKLIVYDVLGKIVATLVNERQNSGNNEVIFNANNLPSGIYFYELKIGNYVDVKKMILIK